MAFEFTEATGASAPVESRTGNRVRWQRGDLTCWCVPELEETLRSVYTESVWVYDALLGRADARVLPGRRPVVTAPLGPICAVVKRLFHGGALAPLTGDRFLSPLRFLTNLRAVDELAAAGIPTPRIVFVAWRRIAGWVRGEIGSELVPGARDASDILFGAEELPPEWPALVDDIAGLVRRLHAAGVLHRDLNLRNFLIATDGQVSILDLDKVRRFPGGLPAGLRRRNLDRLVRSVHKQGRTAAPEAAARVVSRLEATYGA